MYRTLMWATQGFPNRFDCQSKRRPRRQRFEPGEVEDVVIAAADELEAAVAGLGGGEVAVMLGARVAEALEEHAGDLIAIHGGLGRSERPGRASCWARVHRWRCLCFRGRGR